MDSKIRAIAGACLALGLSVGAHASLVSINFDLLDPLVASGTPLNSQYSSQGVSFSGDISLFHKGVVFSNPANDDNDGALIPCIPSATSPTNCKPNGYARTSGGGGFVIQIAADQSFTGFLLDYAAGPAPVEFTVYSRSLDANGNPYVQSQSTTGSAFSTWATCNALLLQCGNSTAPTGKGGSTTTSSLFVGDIDRIVFKTSGIFAIDNLVFTDSGAVVPPSPVPEPASIGLVALALGASGLAARRRRQR